MGWVRVGTDLSMSKGFKERLAMPSAFIVVLLLPLFLAGSKASFAQQFQCPAGSYPVSGGGGMMCQCPDGSYAGLSGCHSSYQQQRYAPQDDDSINCGSWTCRSDQHCSRFRHNWCIADGQEECSNGGTCGNGKSCSRNGNFCVGSSDVDCGSYLCKSGYVCGSRNTCVGESSTDCGNGISCGYGKKCARNGKGCYDKEDVDCGSYACGEGNKCGSGNKCLRKDTVDCGSGRSCSAGDVCRPGGGCATRAQLAEEATQRRREIEERRAAAREAEIERRKVAEQAAEERARQAAEAVRQKKEAQEAEARLQQEKQRLAAEKRRADAEAKEQAERIAALERQRQADIAKAKEQERLQEIARKKAGEEQTAAQLKIDANARRIAVPAEDRRNKDAAKQQSIVGNDSQPPNETKPAERTVSPSVATTTPGAARTSAPAVTSTANSSAEKIAKPTHSLSESSANQRAAGMLAPAKSNKLLDNLRRVTDKNQNFIDTGPGQILTNTLAAAGSEYAKKTMVEATGKVTGGVLSHINDVADLGKAALYIRQKDYLSAAQIGADKLATESAGALGGALMPENPMLGKAAGQASAQFVIDSWKLYGAPVVGDELVRDFPNVFIPAPKLAPNSVKSR
ncbi:MAG: hypothetical protein QOF41_426 [Methylobacteriaceae bacterium]|nr:hypothetical protein [Methylobacteriaceae bacterium]